MNRFRLVLLVLVVSCVVVPTAMAKPRVSVTGAAKAAVTLQAKAAGGTVQTITWERCEARPCTKARISRVATGPTYALSTIDVDRLVRAVAKIKLANGKVRTARSVWKGPVKAASATSGGGSGIPAGEYQCYSGSLLSTLWIDGPSTYRDPSGTPGTYRLVPGSKVYQPGAIKIDWLTGTYAEWENDPQPLWAEYVPVGTPGVPNNQPSTIPTILMTFATDNVGIGSSGWTTCQRKSR